MLLRLLRRACCCCCLPPFLPCAAACVAARPRSAAGTDVAVDTAAHAGEAAAAAEAADRGRLAAERAARAAAAGTRALPCSNATGVETTGVHGPFEAGRTSPPLAAGVAAPFGSRAPRSRVLEQTAGSST